MCGITGFYSKNLSSFDKIIFEMTSAIYHRGPDGINFFKDESSGIAFGHQRLSILDLSMAGSQPMKSNSGRFIITYNGEIYNHLEIRKELKEINSNIIWKSNSDTETLLEACEFWSVEKTLEKIVGMFAFSLWDKKNRTLYLARDRMGEKPLYFGWQGEGKNKSFIFGSELKALKNHPEFSGQINRRAIAFQLRHNYIPDPYSIYKDIYKLLPGHYLKLTENDLIKNRLPNTKIYWSIIKKAIDGSNNKLQSSEDKIKNDLENKLKLSVKQKMISDVPLGAFLSGGIDSSTIVALMQSQSNRPVKTFTIGFNEVEFNEAKYAKKIAKHLGTDHTELYFSSDKALEVIPKLPIIYDEPFSDNSQIPSFILSQLTKQSVKVTLSGDGGDELFCGYNRYNSTLNLSRNLDHIPIFLRKTLAFAAKKLPKDLDKLIKFIPGVNEQINFGRKMHKSINALEANNISELYYLLFSQWQNLNDVLINNEEPENYFSKSKIELSQLNDLEKMMLIDQITYLPNNILVKIDRASMSSSLETRVPFLDHKLIEYVWKIPQQLKFKNNEGKWILKQILNKYVPKNLTNRPKMGFGIPLGAWLSGPLKDWAENLLDEKRLLQEGYFNPKLIRNKWREHLTNKNNWEYDLWNVLMFQAWLDANN